MKYVLLIHWDERAGLARPEAEQRAEMAEHGAFVQALGARLVAGERLQPEASARRVTQKGGRRAVLDGPFAETKEVLGGYYVIECDSHEEATTWAARCPSAKHGTVEVRPVWTA
jgi:hypothetical protein